MSGYIPDRKETLELFRKYNKSESLLRHALSVEAVMRYMARKAHEDVDKWGIIGLIHDLDYEMYPDQHCTMTEKILRENNWPEDYIRVESCLGIGFRC
jgi:predicted hydrolase (HD superfamily)